VWVSLGEREIVHVRSRDGSLIGFERFGAGAPMVLVHGGTGDRTRWTPVASALAERFTVHAMDRRGRGLSDREALDYTVRREGEDVAAVVEAAGRDVYLVGHSYGAICCLEAAQLTSAIGRMVLYEPPIPTPGHPVFPPGAQERLRSAAASNDPERILEVFFAEVIELPPGAIATMRAAPMWQARLDAARTLLREGDAVESYRLSEDLASIAAPVRLFLGTESPHYYRPAIEAVASRLPVADIVPMSGQAHLAIDHDPEQFVASLLAFVNAR
jgi:pimeloyl-ACP methyl ester carboxylesterase